MECFRQAAMELVLGAKLNLELTKFERNDQLNFTPTPIFNLTFQGDHGGQSFVDVQVGSFIYDIPTGQQAR